MTCWRVPGSTEHRDLHQRKSALLAGASPDMGSGLCCNPPGNTDVLYVVDVDGRRLVVVARHYPDSSMEDRAELQAIVDSIVIEP